ncbi:uncharacterized protein ACNLHF_015289 [Anomaloglossus baeobatrachus]
MQPCLDGNVELTGIIWLLQQILSVLGRVCSSPFEVFLFSCAFTLAFFGAFRISELVASSSTRSGGLQAEDMHQYTDRLECFLAKSKTDQQGRGKWIPLFPLSGSRACPVICFRNYVSRRPNIQGSLLIHEDCKSLSQFQFTAVLKKCLTILGESPNAFTSHSFRIGAATEAARWGLEPDIVKKIGRWESSRFKSYIRLHLL